MMDYEIQIKASCVDQDDEFTESFVEKAVRDALVKFHGSDAKMRVCRALVASLTVTRERPPELDYNR